MDLALEKIIPVILPISNERNHYDNLAHIETTNSDQQKRPFLFQL